MLKKEKLYGLMAEFDTAERLLFAAHKVRDAGYRCCDAFSPFPVHGLAEAIGFRRSRVPLLVLIGGVVGGVGGVFIVYYAHVFSDPPGMAGAAVNKWMPPGPR